MSNNRKGEAVFIFIGVLLIVVFAVGYIADGNPDAFRLRYRSDYTMDFFVSFCRAVWLPAGIIGFPMFLISMIISLRNEAKEKRKNS